MIKTTMSIQSIAAAMRPLVPAHLHKPPVLILVAMVAVSLLWNGWVGLSWEPPLAKLLLPPAIFLAVSTIYATIRPRLVIAEVFLYHGLWMLFPVFGARLTYLASAAGLPLQDNLFRTIDEILGFRWIEWVIFNDSYPWLLEAQRFAYDSYYWQPLATVVILAFWGPSGRNRELITATLLALCATILISGLLPALGPAHLYGFAIPAMQTAQDLHAGKVGPFLYLGIVSFPSFHTVMAVLFTLAHRNLKWSFPPFLMLNLLMLTSIPYGGNRYLVDVPGGILIAICAFFASRALCLTFPLREATVQIRVSNIPSVGCQVDFSQNTTHLKRYLWLLNAGSIV